MRRPFSGSRATPPRRSACSAPGNGGDVTQSNDAVAIGAASNGNETKQSIDQVQGGRAMESAKPEHDSKGKHDEKGKGSEYVQVAGQEASN